MFIHRIQANVRQQESQPGKLYLCVLLCECEGEREWECPVVLWLSLDCFRKLARRRKGAVPVCQVDTNLPTTSLPHTHSAPAAGTRRVDQNEDSQRWIGAANRAFTLPTVRTGFPSPLTALIYAAEPGTHLLTVKVSSETLM